VTRWARIALVVLLAWMVAVVIWTSRPWSDTQALIIPPTKKDVAPMFATFECSDLLGAASTPVHHGTLRYPLSREPCRDRSQRRALAVADLGLGVIAIAGVAVLGRRRPAPAAT
jgi:hypothetical protein